jgi:primosomal protein N'
MPQFVSFHERLRALGCALLSTFASILFAAGVFVSSAQAQGVSYLWHTPSKDVQFAVGEILKTKDHQGLPFAVVDKKNAQLFVFNSSGNLQGAAPALLGLTPGDVETAQVMGASTETLGAAWRTTPAGRFVSEPGHNLTGEAIVWVDYAARLAIHRLRPAAAYERRPERLASSTPEDNRITLGCVVVDPAFYDSVVAPVLGKGYGVIYVLPEHEPLQRMHAAAR